MQSVAASEVFHVTVQVFLAELVVDPFVSAFQDGPETLDSIYMGLFFDVRNGPKLPCCDSCMSSNAACQSFLAISDRKDYSNSS